MNQFKKFLEVLNYWRYGKGFLCKLELFLLFLIKILFLPIKVFTAEGYASALFLVSALFLKNKLIKIKNYIFKINNGGDFLILISEKYLNPIFNKKYKGIFLDIGAHIGKYSIIYANNFEHIFAFEPNLITFQYLKKNISINNLKDKIISLPFAVFSESGRTLNFKRKKRNTGSSQINNGGEMRVQTIAIDDFLQSQKISAQAVKLIKVDVEGSEIEVLRGMQNLLGNGEARIIIEIWNNPISRKEEIQSFLKKFGYILKYLGDDNYLAQKNEK